MTAEQLRAWRLRNGMTQPEAAEKVGVTLRVYQGYELNERTIRKPIVKLVRLYEQQERESA